MPKESGSHFRADYNWLVEGFLATMPRNEAMAKAIGGDFLPFGIVQRNVLLQNGLSSDAFLIDLGCGSGRTAYGLRDLPGLNYLGTDVVEALLEHARAICSRPDWEFVTAPGLSIPASDAVADVVCAFSLFTHLLHEESYVYLAEAQRVLKPGGFAIFTFLDFAISSHWAVFETNLERIGLPGHLNQFIDPVAIRVWSKHLGFEVVAIRGGDEYYARLDEPVTLDDGRVFTDVATLGQSLAVLRKRPSVDSGQPGEMTRG